MPFYQLGPPIPCPRSATDCGVAAIGAARPRLGTAPLHVVLCQRRPLRCPVRGKCSGPLRRVSANSGLGGRHHKFRFRNKLMCCCYRGQSQGRRIRGFVYSRPRPIVALDCGHTDYAQFSRWTIAGVKLRHRLKGNAPDQVVNDCEIPVNRGILAGSFGSLARRGRLSRALTPLVDSQLDSTAVAPTPSSPVPRTSVCRRQNRYLNGVKPVKSRLF